MYSPSMTIEEILEVDDSAILLDGFDAAIEGYVQAPDGIRVVYSYSKMVQCLVESDNMAEEDAEDFLGYNTLRAIPYMGCLHPLVMRT